MTLNQYVEKAIESAVSETKGGEVYILSDLSLKDDYDSVVRDQYLPVIQDW